MKGVDNANIDCQPEFRELLALTYKLESKLNQKRAPKGFCHNDLVPQNFIKCEDGMRLVDFDYAGVGWIAVDLASATSQFEMTEDEVESFLLLYDGGLDDGQRGRLAALRFCNNIREISYTFRCAATEVQIPALFARYKTLPVDHAVKIVAEVNLFINICDPFNLLHIWLTYL